MKSFRLYLRLDCELPAKEVAKLNDDQVFELFLKHREENPIGGA